MTNWDEIKEVMESTGDRWMTAKAIHSKMGGKIRIEIIRRILKKMSKKGRVRREECILANGKAYIYKLPSNKTLNFTQKPPQKH